MADLREYMTEILYLNGTIARLQDEIENLRVENTNLRVQNKNQADLLSLQLSGKTCSCEMCEAVKGSPGVYS